jgi:hypothetical protein
MPPTTRCGLGQKMQRGTRAKITPVLQGAKPKVFGARLGQEQGQRMGKAPHCCGASQPKPDVGGTSDGFFRPAIGGQCRHDLLITSIAHNGPNTQAEQHDTCYRF